MSAAYDLRDYLQTQRQETYRSFIVYAPAMSHKTTWARQVQDALSDVTLLNLQQHFVDQPDLAAGIDRFRPDDLESLLLGLDVSEPVVIVDNVDFLLNTWTPHRQAVLKDIISLRLKSPGTTSKVFALVMQDHPRITRETLTNSRGQRRILPLSDFKAI